MSKNKTTLGSSSQCSCSERHLADFFETLDGGPPRLSFLLSSMNA